MRTRRARESGEGERIASPEDWRENHDRRHDGLEPASQPPLIIFSLFLLCLFAFLTVRVYIARRLFELS